LHKSLRTVIHMVQHKESTSDFDGLTDMMEAVDVARDQLSVFLTNIIKHLLQLSESKTFAGNKTNIKNTVSKIIVDEFRSISSFLTQVLWNNIAITVEENERLSSTIQRLRSGFLEIETDRDQLVERAHDLEQEIKTHQKDLTEMSKSMNNLVESIRTLENIQKDYETAKSRLQIILEATADESVSQLVERIINLLLKAGYKIKKNQEYQSKIEQESYRLRKTHRAISMLSEHDTTSRTIMVLAEAGEIDINRLAEIIGQKKIFLKHQLKKWVNRGLIKLSNDGSSISLILNDS